VRNDFLDITEYDPNDSVHSPIWRQNSTPKDSSLTSGLDQYLDYDPLFNSVWREWTAGNEPDLCPSINPDAIEPGRNAASLNIMPEEKRVDSLDVQQHCYSQQPELDSFIDFSHTSDFTFGFDSYSSISFPDEASNIAPYIDINSYLQGLDSFPSSRSNPLFPQTSSTSDSGLVSRPSEPGASCSPVATDHLPSEPERSVPGISHMPLPRLSHLKCPHCPRLWLDKYLLR
jgi:hypothetical protein